MQSAITVVCEERIALANIKLRKFQISPFRLAPLPVLSLSKKWIIPRDTVMTRLFSAILCELLRAS
jgi:hypothetical protein